MPNYQKLYHTIFNAATDALEALEQQDIPKAIDLLKTAQFLTEEAYLQSGE